MTFLEAINRDGEDVLAMIIYSNTMAIWILGYIRSHSHLMGMTITQVQHDTTKLSSRITDNPWKSIGLCLPPIRRTTGFSFVKWIERVLNKQLTEACG